MSTLSLKGGNTDVLGVGAFLKMLPTSVAINDLLGLSDTHTEVLGVNVALFDSSGITDSSFGSFGAAILDAIGALDSIVSDLNVSLSETKGVTDTAVVQFSVEVSDPVDLLDILDAVLTIGRQHIYVDTMVVRVGKNVIDISTQGMLMTVEVESYEIPASAEDARIVVHVEKVEMAESTDEAIAVRQ